MEPRMATAMHRRIETLLQGVAKFAMEKMPLAVPRGKRMLLELEEGPPRRVLREGKTQTEQEHRLAEGIQRLKWGRKLPQAGFG